MNYKDLAIKYQNLTDKLSYQGNYDNGHAYAVVYDRLFEPYRNKSIDFLEIGLNFGGNIAICSEYFPNIKQRHTIFHYIFNISAHGQPIAQSMKTPASGSWATFWVKRRVIINYGMDT